MRVTLDTLSSKLQSTLTNLTARQAQQQTRIATGQRLLQLSDAPTDVSAIVSYRSTIARMQRYATTLDGALAEQTTVENALSQISTSLDSLRTLGIDALNLANHDKWSVFAQHILSGIRALIDAANATHGDIYVLAGTRNTASVLIPTSPETTSLPFELVQLTPSGTNPSGLEVRFKGNNEPRYIQTGDGATEQVSITADRIFGAGGTALFSMLVDLYNTFAYNPDGSPRTNGQLPSQQQLDHVAFLVKQLSDTATQVNYATAELGIRTERMARQRDQLTEDITRQREFLSRLQDTDVAAATIQLQRDQLAYEYSLKVGARLLNISLIDFLR
ncbi:MAG: flagellin [Chlorobi bacterium]|nr:flagellin [Chlorobiota bacterium]